MAKSKSRLERDEFGRFLKRTKTKTKTKIQKKRQRGRKGYCKACGRGGGDRRKRCSKEAAFAQFANCKKK